MHDAAAVELGDAWDRGPVGALDRVEVDNVCRGAFEGEDDWVGWEDGEGGVEFLRRGLAFFFSYSFFSSWGGRGGLFLLSLSSVLFSFGNGSWRFG